MTNIRRPRGVRTAGTYGSRYRWWWAQQRRRDRQEGVPASVNNGIPDGSGQTNEGTQRSIPFGNNNSNRISIPEIIAEGDFRLRFKFSISGNNDILIGRDADNSSFIYVNTSNQLRIRGSNSEGGAIAQPSGGWSRFYNEMVIERVGQNITVTRNGQVLGTTINSATFVFDSLMSGASSFHQNGGLWDVVFEEGFASSDTTGFLPALGRTSATRPLIQLNGVSYWAVNTLPDFSGDYTIEQWFLVNSDTNQNEVLCMAGKDLSGKFGVGIELRGGDTLRAVHARNNSGSSFDFAALPPLTEKDFGKFYFVKSQRVGNTLTISNHKGQSANTSVTSGAAHSGIDTMWLGNGPYLGSGRVPDGGVAYTKITDSAGVVHEFFCDGTDEGLTQVHPESAANQQLRLFNELGYSAASVVNPAYDLRDSGDVAVNNAAPTTGVNGNGQYIGFAASDRRQFNVESETVLVGDANLLLNVDFATWFVFGGGFADVTDGIGTYNLGVASSDKRANVQIPVSANRRERHSIEVKRVNHDWVGFRLQIDGVWNNCFFNINTLTVGGTDNFENATIEPLEDGWLRLSAEVHNRTFNIYQLEAFGGDGVLEWISTGLEKYLVRNPMVTEVLRKSN